MENQAVNTPIEIVGSFNKTNVSKALNELIESNPDKFGSNAKREAFRKLVAELVMPQRVRNDNPYLFAEDGKTVTDILCNRYGIYLPVDHFPAPTDGKYKTTSKVASWLYNEYEKQIKQIESDTMKAIFEGKTVDTSVVKTEIDKLKELQKTGYTDYEADHLAWAKREGKRK